MTSNPKERAALAALDLVEDGMKLGLGTGSTAKFFIEHLGQRVRQGLDVEGVPTSKASEELARANGIPLFELAETTVLDLDIDGSDEITPDGSMIKGGGGAMLREKIVARASKRFVMIADVSKRVQTLGAFPLPIEVIPFGQAATIGEVRRELERLGYEGTDISLRSAEAGGFFETDSGNLVADLKLGRIEDPKALDEALTMIPGVVTTGLFLGCDVHQILATEDGLLNG
ncbi:ribose-5-phosphate isomerase RpiA [Parvularcula sp. ZS-1/3]|uniref:Ribose-5-phosphate isomerase A n=1 Tax=Parvularcula mediterranea TaxID=2732508 RepID=A0A7Y3W6T4_9PROT|nr:ribose-5-phosphate isomerase RpiA [Parvularcula mediterranea]NNU17707.1 ribose-5-phosphate isomerase RpiA [Parvularcula mediterranea]